MISAVRFLRDSVRSRNEVWESGNLLAVPLSKRCVISDRTFEGDSRWALPDTCARRAIPWRPFVDKCSPVGKSGKKVVSASSYQTFSRQDRLCELFESAFQFCYRG